MSNRMSNRMPEYMPDKHMCWKKIWHPQLVTQGVGDPQLSVFHSGPWAPTPVSPEAGPGQGWGPVLGVLAKSVGKKMWKNRWAALCFLWISCFLFLVSYVFCWKQCFSWEFIAAKIASSIGTYWNCIFGCWTRIFGWKMWVDLSSASSLKILPSNLKISTLTLLRIPSIKTFHLNIKS